MKSKRQLLNELSKNLSIAIKAYRGLLQLAQDTQKAILDDQTESLLTIAKEQASLARNLKAHEGARIILIEQLATYLHRPTETLTLSQLIPLIAETYAATYTRLRNELLTLISKLDTFNFQNARLIEESIGYVNEMIGIFATLSNTSSSTYLNTGKIDNSSYNPSVLDYIS